MIRNLFRSAGLVIAAFTIGCTSTQKFDVTVTNKLADPITVWMTTQRGMDAVGWTPPETLAIGTTDTEKLGGVAIEPGDTAQTTISGKIAKDDVAILRIYRAIDLNMILTIHRDDPDRLDIPLDPGKTNIVVVQKNGRMTYEPDAATRPAD